MPLEDAARWNTRYQKELRDSFEQPRPFLVENAHYLPASGLALDLAMGLGGNAEFLIQHGLRVIGVDIAEFAVHRAYARLPTLMPVIADLTHFHFPPATFDVIIVFFYLQRDLWPILPRSLRQGGILIYETLTLDMQAIHPEIDPGFLLNKGELSRAFPSLSTLIYREGWVNYPRRRPRSVASLVAQKLA